MYQVLYDARSIIPTNARFQRISFPRWPSADTKNTIRSKHHSSRAEINQKRNHYNKYMATGPPTSNYTHVTRGQ